MDQRPSRRTAALRLSGAFALLLGISVSWLGSSPPAPAEAQAQPTATATPTPPLAGPVGPLAFSRQRTADNRPVVPAPAFKYSVPEVWVTFDYNLPAGARLSRIVRFDNEDTIYGDLPYTQSSGRYAFRIAAAPPGSLAEGDWQIFIYVNGVQASAGGFSVFSGGAPDPSIARPTPTPTSSTTTVTVTEGGNDNGDGNGNGGGNGNGNDND